ncbi:MAG TPA: hypothetical protein VKW77_10865 [Acidimicrobiales bacterium]|nr:hypothetical protein [Acidimicrobiales bacterium]
MIASALASFLAVAGLLALAALGAAAVAAFLVGRSLRRRWRLLRSHGLVIAALALWDATAALRARRRPPPTTVEELWASPGQVRRVLRRSVAAAGDAVRTAEELGAAVAELPALARRLQSAASDLDRVLRLEPAGPVPPSIRRQVRDVLRAADDVRRLAVAAAGDACDPGVSELLRDTADEVQLLGAGLASARAAAGLSSR